MWFHACKFSLYFHRKKKSKRRCPKMLMMALFEWRDFEEGLWIFPFSSPLLPFSLLFSLSCSLPLHPSFPFSSYPLYSASHPSPSSLPFSSLFLLLSPSSCLFFMCILILFLQLNYFITFKKNPERVNLKNSVSQISTSTILLLWHLFAKGREYHWKERYHDCDCCYCYSVTFAW